MKNILIATDDWHPHISGVVTTLSMVKKHLEDLKYNVDIVHPRMFRTLGLPVYKDIRICNPLDVLRWLKNKRYDAIHISTPEGSVGTGVRICCWLNKLKYTTTYHTRIPEYGNSLAHVPLSIGYAYERMVHGGAEKIFVTTKSMQKELLSNGFKNDKIVLWNRGVDLELFNPNVPNLIPRMDNEKILLYVGRISKEKNIEDMINLESPETDTKWIKIVVGDGPYRDELEKKYARRKDVYFEGKKIGMELAQYYASTDVFVFPSKTDTFGLVMLEAMACGTPVAGYEVTGPKDVINYGISGFYGNNLTKQVEKALELDRVIVRNEAERWSWDKSVRIFLENLCTNKELLP